MKPLGLLSQLFAIAIAVSIVFLFVIPTLNETEEVQDQIAQYATAREQVNETNATLASQKAELESIPFSEKERIATYMPTALDEVAVLRDLEIIAETAGVTYGGIQFVGEQIDESEEGRLSADENLPVGHEFDMQITGSYTRIKDFLSLVEQNQYPLHVFSLDMTALEGGFLQATVSIITYTDNQFELNTL